MTDVTSATAAAAASPIGATARAGATANYDMFLKLLTAQMQNQDPLNPADATQYTAQLAQFSQVEQSLQQTDALKNILSQLSTQDIGQLSNLIGREAEFDTATAGLSATSPAGWRFASGQSAPLVATITNAAGAVVDTREIASATDGRFAWNGVRADGTRVPDGAYTLSLATADQVAVPVRAAGTVTDVLSSGGTVSLSVNDLAMAASKLVRVSATSH